MERFQSIQPSSPLAPYIRQYWFITADASKQRSQRVIPAGSIGLTFSRETQVYLPGEVGLLPRSYISGQSTRYTDINFKALDSIIIVFQPIGGRLFFRMPMNELRNNIISINALSDSRILELEERLMNTIDNTTCVRYIEDFLMKSFHPIQEYNYKRLASVIGMINQGESDIWKLSQTACLSYKQFKRIFAEYTGLNPKDYLQITRFSKASHLLQVQPKIGISELADDCGYYDKSHLIKDFKTFSGYTPMEFLSNSDSYSDIMALFRSFFIEVNS